MALLALQSLLYSVLFIFVKQTKLVGFLLLDTNQLHQSHQSHQIATTMTTTTTTIATAMTTPTATTTTIATTMTTTTATTTTSATANRRNRSRQPTIIGFIPTFAVLKRHPEST